MKSSRLEEDKNIEENVIKDVRNLLRLKKLKKETNDVTNKAIKYRIIRDIRNLVRVNNLWSSNYIEYKSQGDRKTLSVKNILIKLDHT